MRAENIHRLKDSATAADVSGVFTMSGTSQQSAAFPAHCYEIRVATQGQPAWIAIGTNPTAAAAAGSILVGSNQTEYFRVTPGQKLAVLQAGTAGVFSIGFMTR